MKRQILSCVFVAGMLLLLFLGNSIFFYIYKEITYYKMISHGLTDPRTDLLSILVRHAEKSIDQNYLRQRGDGQEVLFAHAPSVFALPLQNESEQVLRLTFECGLFERTWQDPTQKTDGVRFVISGRMVDRSEEILWQQEFTPFEKQKYRSPGQFELDRLEQKYIALLFQTESMGNTVYDWAYWTKVRLRKTTASKNEHIKSK